MINQQRIVTEFCELIRLGCASKAEREVGDAVKAKLAALGLEVFEDDVAGKFGGNCGNLIGFMPGSLPQVPTLLLSAHLDSVAPCAGIEPEVKDGVITSRGDTILAADNKSGIVAILEGLRVVREQNIPHGDIQVVITVAEEVGLYGSRYIDRSLLKADLGYVLDNGGAPGGIINTAPGQNSIKIIVRGKTAHAGVAPEEGINAIVVAGKAMAELKQGRIDAETTANVGVITGGKATNIVPDYVEIACEARSRNLAKLDAQTQHMVETFERVAAANGAQAEVSVQRIYDPYLLAEDTTVITLARQAAAGVGLESPIGPTGGGADANYFNVYGIPTAVLNTGQNKVHTTDEYITVADLSKTAELVVSLITTVAAKQKA